MATSHAPKPRITLKLINEKLDKLIKKGEEEEKLNQFFIEEIEMENIEEPPSPLSCLTASRPVLTIQPMDLYRNQKRLYKKYLKR